MKKCVHSNSRVIDSRKRDGIVRRRECKSCGEKFTTKEYSLEQIEELEKLARKVKTLRTYIETSFNRFKL